MDPSEGAPPHVEHTPIPQPAPTPPAEGLSMASPPKPSAKKPWWWIGVIVAVLAIGALVIWQHKALYNRLYSGSVIFKVEQGGTFPVSGAELAINGLTYTTNGGGNADIASIVAGTYKVTVQKTGYATVNDSITLHRGSNGTETIAVTKVPTKVYSITGYTDDYVSGQPLVNVSVTLGTTTLQTDPSGAYTFTGQVPGSYTLYFVKAGFTNKDLTVTVSNTDSVTPNVPLVPTGTVVFTSNASQKRLLYTINYDGSGQKELAAQTTGEDYQPLLSPNGKTVAFLSTRDNAKNSYGAIMPKLYIVNLDGTNLKKVSDDLIQGTIQWSANSTWLYFEGFSDAALTQPAKGLYNVSTGTTITLGSDAGSAIFTPDGTAVLYVSTTLAADGVTNQYSLVSLTLANNTKTTLIPAQTDSISNLILSTDGQSISYDDDNSGTHTEYTVALGGGQAQAVSAVPTAPNPTTVIAPNGTLKAYIDTRNGQTNLYISNLDGSNEHQVTTLGTIDPTLLPVWDASSNYLVVGVKTTGDQGLYVVSATSGEPKKITDYYTTPPTT